MLSVLLVTLLPFATLVHAKELELRPIVALHRALRQWPLHRTGLQSATLEKGPSRLGLPPAPAAVLRPWKVTSFMRAPTSTRRKSMSRGTMSARSSNSKWEPDPPRGAEAQEGEGGRLVGLGSSASELQNLGQSHAVFEFEVLFNTSSVETLVALRVLRRLRPRMADLVFGGETIRSGKHPWSGVAQMPTHKYRTFDMRRKLTSVLANIVPQRPADTVLLVRLLFDEYATSTSETARGYRPLTVGEICENWDLLRERCARTWAKEDEWAERDEGDEGAAERSLSRLDDAVFEEHRRWLEEDIESYAGALAWNPSTRVNEAVSRLLGRGMSQSATVLVRSTSPLAHTGIATAAIVEEIVKRRWSEAIPIEVARVASIEDIERLLRNLAVSDGGGVTYFGVRWQPLILLSRVFLATSPVGDDGNVCVSFHLVEWAQRHSTRDDRAEARQSEQVSLLTVQQLVPNATPSFDELRINDSDHEQDMRDLFPN